MDSRIALRLWGSTPTVGSSRSSSRGWWRSPMPMLSRRCMPPLKRSVRSLPRSVRPMRSQDLLDSRLERRAAEAVEPAEEREVLARRQVRVDRQLLGHVPDAGLRRDRPDVDGAGRPRVTVAAVPCEQAADHRDGRGLAGAVGAQQAVRLALVDPEADALDGLDGAEGLAQVPGLEDDARRLPAGPEAGSAAEPGSGAGSGAGSDAGDSAFTWTSRWDRRRRRAPGMAVWR